MKAFSVTIRDKLLMIRMVLIILIVALISIVACVSILVVIDDGNDTMIIINHILMRTWPVAVIIFIIVAWYIVT